MSRIRYFGVKNKLARALGEGDYQGHMHAPILLRHVNDENYPYKKEGSDGAWQEHPVVEQHPLGLLVESRKHLAFVDRVKKEFDYLEDNDLVSRHSGPDRHSMESEDVLERRRAFHDYHQSLPERHRGIYVRHDLVRYKDILAVDDKGDSWYKIPHVFVDMELGRGASGGLGPFTGGYELIELGREPRGSQVHLGADWKRVSYFPAEPPSLPPYRVIEDRELAIPDGKRWGLRSGGVHVYDIGKQFGDLRTRDVIRLTHGQTRDGGETQPWVEVVEAVEMTASSLMSAFGIGYIEELEHETGGKLTKRSRVRAVELRAIYEFAFRPRPLTNLDPA